MEADDKKHKTTKINVHGFEFEIITLNNGSQINIQQSAIGVIPGAKTFWIDLQFEVEKALNVRIMSIELRASDLRRQDFKDTIHFIHEIKLSTEEFAKLIAHEEAEELHRMHALTN